MSSINKACSTQFTKIIMHNQTTLVNIFIHVSNVQNSPAKVISSIVHVCCGD